MVPPKLYTQGRVLEASVTYMAVDSLARLVVVCCVTHSPLSSSQALLSRLLAVMVGCAKVG